MRSHLVMLLLVLGLNDTGCGTWSGNPRKPGSPTPTPPPAQGLATVSLTFRGDSSGAALAGTGYPVKGRNGAVTGTVALTSARVVLKEIRIKTRGDDAEQREEFKGPFVVDLITNAVTPDPGTISLAAGSYAEIELKLDKSDLLGGNSVDVEGMYTDTAGNTRPLKLTHDVGETFSLTPSAPLAVQAGDANPIVIAFQLAAWFDLSSAGNDLSDVEGDLTFGKDSSAQPARKIRDAVKDNLKRSANPQRDGSGAKPKPGSAPGLPSQF